MTKIACILLVDDEKDLAWAVRSCLSDDNHEILIAHDGLEGLTLARSQRPDLIILDIIMPRMDGLAMCHQLRRDPTLAAVPILFLTALGSVNDRIKGLQDGGDDYLVKPFDVGELRARVAALLRRSQTLPFPAKSRVSRERGSLLRVGDLALNRHTRQVQVGERTEQLTPVEYELCYYLMTHPGQTFSSKQLLAQVWDYPTESADPGLVRWHIKNLRSKIEPDPRHPVFIRTVSRHGYILEEHQASQTQT